MNRKQKSKNSKTETPMIMIEGFRFVILIIEKMIEKISEKKAIEMIIVSNHPDKNKGC